MRKKQRVVGTCKLCQKTKDLTFEHIPPKVAFNSQTRYRNIPYVEFIKNTYNANYKFKGPIFQGGLGDYYLCTTCNSFLGSSYVPAYYTMALAGKYILQNYKAERVEFTIEKLSPLRLLKQVISMFICINKPEFTLINPELLLFVKNTKEQFLPDKYKIYAYLNHEGKTKSISWQYSNINGMLSEIAFRPLGFVLSINHDKPLPYLSEITSFKNFEFSYDGPVRFELNLLATHSPYAAQYEVVENFKNKSTDDESV